MKKSAKSKLKLNRETLTALEETQMGGALGLAVLATIASAAVPDRTLLTTDPFTLTPLGDQ